MTDTMASSATPAAAPTLNDVAREAGVSLATASRVLNGSTRKVADSYRAKVQAAAERLGYTANVSAQAIARGTSPTIALLVADIADAYFGQIASGVAQDAVAAGLIVTIAMTGRDTEREVALLRALRGQRPRGIVLAASRDLGVNPALVAEIEAVRAMGARVVTLGSQLPGTRMIAYDNRAGAHALAMRLGGLGYREAVILSGPEQLRTSRDRLVGFSAGFTDCGGRILRVVNCPISRDGGHQGMQTVLRDGIEPGTLVAAVSDVVAIGAMSALRDAGRAPGTDVAVAGFDDIVTSRDITPGLTTVRVPLEEIGARALRAVIEDEWDQLDPLRLEVIVRGSTPPRPA